ncbi:MAG: hypothetical protein WCP10_09045 [Desulfuromonadales bacterium]
MPKRIVPLSYVQVKNAKPQPQDYKLMYGYTSTLPEKHPASAKQTCTNTGTFPLYYFSSQHFE